MSRSLKEAQYKRQIDSFQGPRGCPSISHLLFADDTLIFSKATIVSVRNLQKLLAVYEQGSGQLINVSKSGFLLHPKTNVSTANQISRMTGFIRHSFPLKYLGFPLVLGRRKKVHFAGIIHSIQRRISGWKSSLLSQGAKLTLIRHVLTSIPIYTLSTTSLHSGTHQLLEQSFANFFWGSSPNGNKRHWISWDLICRPISQGGLGIMSLRQMDIALRVKMLWQALHSTSLWASYFRTKHIGQLHLRDVTFHRMAGPARRSWMKAKQLILQYHRIIIGDGRNTNFWHDHWIGQHCLSDFLPDNSIPNSTITVKDFLQHPQREEIDLLNSFIPAHLKTAIVHTTLNLENDIPVWSLSSSGQCTVASTKKVLTDSPFNQSAIQWASLWSPWLPIKISVHIWKILHNCLPVDRNIQRLGIQISSKCSCCQAPQGESLNHLFIHSELAVHIWSYFQAKGITLAGNSVATFITTAVRNIKSNSAHGLLVLAVLGFSLWEIWRARNSMRYEGCAISHSRVLHQIIAKTKQVCISASYKENDIPKR